MKGSLRFSLIDRFVASKSRNAVPETDDTSPVRSSMVQKKGDFAQTKLAGPSLEQAYRYLMLENQVLAESNERLHELLARIEGGIEESPAAKQLIRAQRNALAERSHRLRELQYENVNLKREQNKLAKENRKLAASLARGMQDVQPLRNELAGSRRELEEAEAALREKTKELAMLTDKYYQLEARSKPQRSVMKHAG